MSAAMAATAAAASGIRVVEHGAGLAVAYAGALLARMGARVTRLEQPAAGAASADGPLQLARAALALGKHALPRPDAPAAWSALLADCDVLLSDAPRALDAHAGPVAALRAAHPRLVLGIASVFGLDGPLADVPAEALDAQALSGMAWALGEPGREPLSLPPGIVEHQAGAMLAAGCLLALNVRDECGSGRVVDIALADVLASHVAGNCRFYVHHGLQWQRSGRRASGSGGAYPFVILPCRDGAVCVCGRTREEWERLVAAMGSPAWAAEPRYQDLRAMGTRYPEEVDALVMPWFAARTKAELEAIALEHNLIVSPLRDFAEVLQTAQFAERDYFAAARIAGRPVRVPGLPFRFRESRARSAPDLAAGLLAAAPPRPPAPPAPAPAQPLAGVRVLDFGWVWSAPWVSTMLGELGARVIKVEHGRRPDNLRLSGRVMRDGQVVSGPSREMSPMYHQVNHGKWGITLNTKDPRAVALLRRLATQSDLVVENMSPGSMERSGLGYEDLRAINPRLVMLAMSAAGQTGPLAGMRAYAPTMSSFVGMESLIGYPGEAPLGALNVALGDPNAAVHGLVAVLAALRRQRLTGRGCYIDLAQNEALLGTLAPYLLDAQVHDRQPPTTGNRHPEMAPHGIYPAAGDDAWLTIAVADDAQWRAFAGLAADQPWAGDARFGAAGGRLALAGELDRAVAQWTRGIERDLLVARLRAAGIAATPVLTVEAMWRHPQFAARAMRHAIEIPVYGPDTVMSAPWRFSDFAPRVESCGPGTGAHNRQVLGELLGVPDDELAALEAAGVVA
ncbi:MAG: CoA transferase [Burkholderiales bacterium]|nr:CoA transferase [Burkholderiales bacterium]